MAIPVTAIRLLLDKEHLHDSKCTDRFVDQYLSGTNCTVFIAPNDVRQHIHVAAVHFVEENRVMDLDRSNVRIRARKQGM